jgi:hypothetical protein
MKKSCHSENAALVYLADEIKKARELPGPSVYRCAKCSYQAACGLAIGGGAISL